jgi:hypothetical protein
MIRKPVRPAEAVVLGEKFVLAAEVPPHERALLERAEINISGAVFGEPIARWALTFIHDRLFNIGLGKLRAPEDVGRDAVKPPATERGPVRLLTASHRKPPLRHFDRKSPKTWLNPYWLLGGSPL